jgi:predicted branched-subunit amino acid permease
MTREPTTSVPSGRPGGDGLLLSAAPLAAAIGVFGIVFGAAASAQMDPALAILMSALVFSGTLQFATLGLLASGAGALPVVLTAIALNSRHVVIGAVLRPRLQGSALRRAVMAWFLIDESFGLALASPVRRTGFVLVAGGVIFYLAWLVGTALGIGGARVVAIEGIAAAIFPVLFIGLAALTVRNRRDAARALLAAGVVAALSLLPAVYPFAVIIAALAVALPGARQR